MTMATQPDHQAVREVMQACGCDEERALSLLRRCNNDIEKAKTHHRNLMRYLTPPSAASQPSSGPSPSSFGRAPAPVQSPSPFQPAQQGYQPYPPPLGTPAATSPAQFPPTSHHRISSLSSAPRPSPPPPSQYGQHSSLPPYQHQQQSAPTPFQPRQQNPPPPLQNGQQNAPTAFQNDQHSSPPPFQNSQQNSPTPFQPGQQYPPPSFPHGQQSSPPPMIPPEQQGYSSSAYPRGPSPASFQPAPLPSGPSHSAPPPAVPPHGIPGTFPVASSMPVQPAPAPASQPAYAPMGEFPGASRPQVMPAEPSQPAYTAPAPTFPGSSSTSVPVMADIPWRNRNGNSAESSYREDSSRGPILTPPSDSDDVPVAQPQQPVPIHPRYSMPPVAPPVPERPAPSSHQRIVNEAASYPVEPPVDTSKEWNFVLPDVPEQTLMTGNGDNQALMSFDVQYLVGSICHGATQQSVNNYLARYEKKTVEAHINDEIYGLPSIFYVVGTNEVGLVRTWLAHGADLSAVHPSSGTPLLAFAIMNGETINADTTSMVSTLLSHGSSSKSIPPEFYSPYSQDIPLGGPEREKKDAEFAWCDDRASKKLARTINLTHRYNLERAAKIKKPSVRHRQVAHLRNANAILGIPFFLIGQTMAANRLLSKLLSYLMIPSRRPLVMAFAGPSGHGKTELARCLGNLMDLELEVVDCTIFNREMELFGPRHPYTGADRGSPLNNFLSRNSGQRCIVFLDEFEKTTTDIHQALLLPFDKGEYQDRRTLNNLDCSKTIWILATNALDSTIQDFCGDNEDILNGDDAVKDKLGKELSKELRAAFLSHFDAPLTGRISEFIPFLPFSKGEQAVVVHKFLLELVDKARLPINLSAGSDEQLLGNVRLRVNRDASVCRTLAEGEYSADLGARSLATAVKQVEDMLVDAYLDEEEEIVETDVVKDFVVDVSDGVLSVGGLGVRGS